MFKRTNNTAARDAFLAREDLQRANSANQLLWNGPKTRTASDFAEKAQRLYEGCRVWINYRKNWIAIKVERPTAEQRDSEAVRNLDWSAATQFVDIVETKTGVIYRIR